MVIPSQCQIPEGNCEGSGQNRHLAKVFVVQDLTVKQREDRKKLRDELIKRRGEGEQDLGIRGSRNIKKSEEHSK